MLVGRGRCGTSTWLWRRRPSGTRISICCPGTGPWQGKEIETKHRLSKSNNKQDFVNVGRSGSQLPHLAPAALLRRPGDKVAKQYFHRIRKVVPLATIILCHLIQPGVFRLSGTCIEIMGRKFAVRCEY